MKKKLLDETFVIRPYEKGELAKQYLPGNCYKVAVRKFNMWIRLQSDLWRELQATGFVITERSFTRKQVELIVKYLGEP